MKKIAMLNCLKANEVCTGAACMKAFNEKSRSFERYREEETVVAAFMRCNGCDAHPGEDKGLQEKLDRQMCIRDRYSSREIAETLNLNDNTVRSKQSRADVYKRQSFCRFYTGRIHHGCQA